LKVTELKEKYNECLSLLGKTQEELYSLRKKNPSRRNMSKSASAASNVTMINSSSLNADIEEDDDGFNNERNNISNNIGLRTSSSLFSPWMPTSNTSLAAEVFSTLAKDFRSKNSTL
jgi:hypothetical protein